MTTATTKGGNRSTIIAPGWTLADAEAAIVDSTIDHYRFANRGDRALALVEGDEGHALFPDADDLRASGIDVEKLAIALRNGLDPVQVAEMRQALEAATINGVLDEFQS